MHVLTCLFVALVGLWKPLDNLANCVQSVCIGKHGSCSGDVGLNGVGQCVHTGMSNELHRHAIGELRVNDGNVRGNLEVSDWVLNALLIVGNNREGRDLGCGAGSRGNCAEVSLGAELGKAKDLAHILKGCLRILILDPHCLRGVDW